MTEYVITIKNGDYPLTYRAKTITDAFQCLVTAEKNHHLDFSAKFLDTDSLMATLVSMKNGKCIRVKTDEYTIDRVTVPFSGTWNETRAYV